MKVFKKLNGQQHPSSVKNIRLEYKITCIIDFVEIKHSSMNEGIEIIILKVKLPVKKF